MTTPEKLLLGASCLLALSLGAGCSKGAAETPAGHSAAESSTLGATTSERAATQAIFEPIPEYRARCSNPGKRTLDCEFLRGLVVAQVVDAFQAFERARDQRGIEPALRALGILGEPEVLIAACRVLGNFTDAPGIAERVPPLLDSPFLEVQRIAAQLLSRNGDQALAAMGRQWLENHATAEVPTPYGELDFPAHYDGMGFPDYPGSERYTPADSDRSIAWWSPEPPATVAERLGETLGVRALTYAQWAELAQQRFSIEQEAAKTIVQAKMAEIQKLNEQHTKTPDEKLMKRIEAAYLELAAPVEQAEADRMKAVERVAVPPGVSASDQIHMLVAEERGGHPSRVILVYRQPLVERTVMQMAWDLRDYPPAWAPKPD